MSLAVVQLATYLLSNADQYEADARFLGSFESLTGGDRDLRTVYGWLDDGGAYVWKRG